MAAPSGSSSGAEPLAAGPAIAATLGLAAGLAELTATVCGGSELAARARALRAEVEPLGAEDAAAYAAFLRGEPGARERTIEVPTRLTELGTEIARLCEQAASQAQGPVSGDARTGALLADAAASAAGELVRINRGDPLS